MGIKYLVYSFALLKFIFHVFLEHQINLILKNSFRKSTSSLSNNWNFFLTALFVANIKDLFIVQYPAVDLIQYKTIKPMVASIYFENQYKRENAKKYSVNLGINVLPSFCIIRFMGDGRTLWKIFVDCNLFITRSMVWLQRW